MFYNQPLGTRFGTDLNGELASGKWTRLQIAVAWVRATGLAHIDAALRTFLKAGHSLSVIVGLDLENTTKEGLDSLLALEALGNSETYVHHNEAGSLFHPKLYLFANASNACLIVGSNNLTQAGLYQNTEAGLQLSASIKAPPIVAAENALAEWRNTSSGFAKRLDPALLKDLVTYGYVPDEAAVKAARAARRATRTGKGGGKKLFASRSYTPPTLPVGLAGAKSPPSKLPASTPPILSAAPVFTGSVLLMRVRKAGLVDRPTQTQVPIRVLKTPFFGGVTSVTSAHDGQPHKVVQAKARGAVNTMKLEIPEMRSMADPVVRFEKTAIGIQYEVYDSKTPQGATIMGALAAGLITIPAATFLTLPAAPKRSTWWRFI